MWQAIKRYLAPRAGAPTPASIALGDPESQFQFACSLLDPYLQLHARRARRVGASDRAVIERAVGLLEGIVRDYPTSWPSRWFLGKARQVLGQHEAACDAFGGAFELEKANPDVAREYSVECLRLGRAEAAVEAAVHAATVAPEDAGLRANVALAYVIAGRNDEALTAAIDALGRSPRDVITRRLVAAVEDVIAGRRPQPRRLADLG